MFYSKSTGGFYPAGMRKDYDAKGTWPADAVEITDEERQTLLTAELAGLVITADENGRPIAAPAKPPTQEQINAQRKIEILAEFTALDMQRIRPLAENNTTKLAELNAQAQLLRDELKSL